MQSWSSFCAFIVCVLFLAGCNVQAGELEIRDPVREAEATRVAMAARDEAARRAIERRIVEAQADQARAEAEAVRHALPAMTLRNALIQTGLGVGALVLAIGSAFAVVGWLNKRAISIYPNSAGMYPVIVKRLWNGVTIVHDPNRALGPTTIYTAPRLSAALLGKGKEAPPAAHFPAPGSEGSMLQLATQAQAIGLMAAVTRKSGGAVDAHQAGQVAQALINRPAIAAPLPPVRPSRLEPSHVERLLRENDE